MKTLPTLNSHNFKYVKCPVCDKYPNRHGKEVIPKIIFTGVRWVAESRDLEFQGSCEHCFKEWRIVIRDFSLNRRPIGLYDPKKHHRISEILLLEENVRR